MRIISEFVLSAFLFLGLPAAAQEADSASRQVPAADSVKSVDLLPWEFRQLVREQNAARRQRINAARLGYEGYKPQHDLRVMVGFGPMPEQWNIEEWAEHNPWNPAYDVLYSKYEESFFGRHCFASLSVSYAYRVAERWEIGAVVSYTGFYNGLWRVSDSRKVETHREYYLSVMPQVRYSWMSRKRFRLYSGLDLGLLLAARRSFFEDSFRSRATATAQCTFLGMTLGREFFFSAELGAGCRGILNLGMGWRFDAKNTRR